MIRPYNTADNRQLATIHNTVFPDRPHTASSFGEYAAGTRALGGFVWVIGDSSLAGYGSVTPVPGLPGIAELDGCIAAERRRQGLGSRLLAGILDGLKNSNIRQVTFAVESLAGPTAVFFQKHHFFVEHEEIILAYDEVQGLPQEDCPDQIIVQTFPRQTAVAKFCELYEKSFSGLPWDQPFSRSEVEETLDQANDILFLTLEGEAIGFAWTRLDAERKGVVEPLGIIPNYQNKGYGRCLLTTAIRILVHRGVQRIEIGAWHNNRQAIKLYRSVGFEPVKTITYLAYNLSS